MYIWHILRLLARRWAVSVPMLLLTAAAAAVSASNVPPDYVATAYVSLLPPSVRHNPAPGETRQVNPWDAGRLTSAVIVRLNTRSLAGQIKREGFDGTWAAGLDREYGPVIRLEVTASTEAAARSTMSRLLRELHDEVTRQQARYPGLGPDDMISAARFDSGDEVRATTTKIRWATAVAAAIGLLMTAAVSGSVDAVLRRRTRDRSGADVRQPSTDTEATQPVRITNLPWQTPTAGAPPALLLNPGRSSTAAASRGSTPASDDSTIVLPFSNAPWAERQASRAAGDGEAGKPTETTRR